MIENKEVSNQLKLFIDKSNKYLNSEQNKDKAIAFIYVILSLISLSFFGIFAIGPTLTTITSLKKEYEENQLVLQQLETKVRNLNSLRIQYEELKDDLPLLELAIPASPKVPSLTRQLETLASKNNLTVDKLDTGLLEIYPTKNTNSPIFSYSFTFNLKGNQENINTFIQEIVKIDRIIGLEKLSIYNKTNEYSSVVNGKAFFYKP